MSAESIFLSLQIQTINNDNEADDQNTRLLFNEIKEETLVSFINYQPSGAQPDNTKGVDPLITGALVVALAPTALSKFLEFLHAWTLRREGRTIKIKVKNETGNALEIEVPQVTSKEEVKAWIRLVEDAVQKSAKVKK